MINTNTERMTYSVHPLDSVWFQRIPGSERARNESQLMYWITGLLKDAGYDVVKKIMWKDGHMVDDHIYYIRERRGKWCLWDGAYQIRNLAEDYNSGKRVCLQYINWDEEQI